MNDKQIIEFALRHAIVRRSLRFENKLSFNRCSLRESRNA